MEKILNYEISDTCKACIKRHIKNKGKFDVKCVPFPKELDNHDNPYYPLEKIIGQQAYDNMNDETKAEIQLMQNKVLWAKSVLGWTTFNKARGFDQHYQREILLCTAKLKTVRCGRRMGKTESVIIDALHYALNNPGKNVLYIGPFQYLIDAVFDRIDALLSSDQSAFRDQYSRKRKPNTIKFSNGSAIIGFTTGKDGASIRGQSADRVYFDEAAYIPELAFRTTLAFLLDNPNVTMTATSTPIAIEGNFKNWCLIEKDWKDFHYPSTILPHYESIKKVLQNTYTREDFKLEVLAEFSDSHSNVFKTQDINNSLFEYKYINSRQELKNPNSWKIAIGVDYNEYKNGVQIVVLGFNKYNLSDKPFRVLKRVSIHTFSSDGSTTKNIQMTAVNTIKDLYHQFQADYVYVDQGHGSMQNEVLSKYFYEQNAFNVFKGIDFGKAYEYEDIYTQEKKTKRLKVMMVYFLQKRFELNEIKMSITEEPERMHSLTDQIKGYRINKFDSREDPVFGGEDHILDALMLANFAIVENNDAIFDKRTGNIIASIDKGYTNKSDPNKKENELFSQQKPKNDQIKIQPILPKSDLRVISIPSSKKRRRNNFDFWS